MKNPVLNSYFTTIGYIITVIFVAVIYAFTASSTSSGWAFIIADASVSAFILIFEIIFLWNSFQYGLPSMERLGYRTLSLILVGIPFIGLVIGFELAMTALWFEPNMLYFYGSILERVFILALIYVIASMYYLHKIEIADIAEDNFREELAQSNEEKEMNKANAISRINIKTGNGIKVIPVEEILFIKADGDYISVNTTEGHWLKEQTMKSIEGQLSSDTFIRVHRSYIINTVYLTSIERYGQQQMVQMRSGEKIKISPTGYKILREKLDL